MVFRKERRGDRRHRHRKHGHEPQHQRVYPCDAEIGEPAARLGDGEPPLRADQFDRRHDEEHAREHAEAQQPVALAEKTVHGGETSR